MVARPTFGDKGIAPPRDYGHYTVIDCRNWQRLWWREERNIYDDPDEDGPDAAEKDEAIACSLCKMFLNGPHQYQDHLKGKRHRKNLSRQRIGLSDHTVLSKTVVDSGDDPGVRVECLDVSETQSTQQTSDHLVLKARPGVPVHPE